MEESRLGSVDGTGWLSVDVAEDGGIRVEAWKDGLIAKDCRLCR